MKTNPGVFANYRAQPMLAYDTHSIVGYEVLYRHRIDFNNKSLMLQVDIGAVKAARALCRYFKNTKRIHFNAELASMLSGDWIVEMTKYMSSNMVVEIVERNEPLSHPLNLALVDGLCSGIRQLGGAIALDDVSGTDLEKFLIDVLKPEILKANNPQSLEFISSTRSDAIVIAEHIESPCIANDAVLLGASELQGYWCDVLKENEVPRVLTLPGVMARDLRMMTLAA